ncbi:hypothetical protein [Bythopirellula polymerisocia]|uniref:hypothetical protein n=1 Tax=Bythopirellula polymerisocia TaxID=2528003 RepID=UPI0011B810D7|nr:hypothetical protein [Bythopirellula polymerisocia]
MGSTFTADDLDAWAYGYAIGSAGALSAASTVPEPAATSAALVIGLQMLIHRRLLQRVRPA